MGLEHLYLSQFVRGRRLTTVVTPTRIHSLLLLVHPRILVPSAPYIATAGKEGAV